MYFSSIYGFLLALPGSLISGIIVYFVLSSLIVPFTITGPISIIISLLIFGLANYYSNQRANEQLYGNVTEKAQNNKKSISNIFFASAYIILIIFAFLSEQNSEIFVHWEQITEVQIISLVAAIILSLFAPGYALVSVLDRKHELGSLPRFLVAYLLSLFLTALAGYIIASIGLAVSSINTLLAFIHIVILAQFVWVKILVDKDFVRPFRLPNASKVLQLIKQNFSEVLVFASLFSLVILSTYYLYNGTLIGDPWYHYGRSLLFLSGTFKDVAVSGIEQPYPPFQHAFLASFFSLSSVPSVNAYVSLNFLNIMPVFAFYYFFTKWLPDHRKAALLASTLFMLSSGFGWAYLINLTADNPAAVASPMAALEAFKTAGIKTFDIYVPNTFIDVGHPDITTGLIIIALPAGFVLLGLIKEKISGKLKYIALITGVSTLGYLSHDEFGFFLIVASVIPLVLRLNGKNTVFAAILVSLSFVILVAVFSPGDYYRVREFFGVPYIVLYFLFVSSMWALYASKFLYRLNAGKKTLPNILKRIVRDRQVRLILGVGIVSVVSYLYILSFIVWYFQLPIFDIRVNTDGFKVVPWHLYPLRFGITGLVGLCFILSYVFKKFEKEVFIFGIMAIIAFITLPQNEEVRANKYIMVSMAGFASLLLYKIFSMQRQSLKKPLINGIVIGLFITSSSLSILMFVGYSALGLENRTALFSLRIRCQEDIFLQIQKWIY